MFYDLYKAIKTKMSELEELKIAKFSTKGLIPAEPAARISFPDPVPVESLTKTSNRDTISVQVDIVSKAFSEADGYIKDDVFENHDILADAARYLLDGATVTEYGKLKLKEVSISGEDGGWLVTTMSFELKRTFAP